MKRPKHVGIDIRIIVDGHVILDSDSDSLHYIVKYGGFETSNLLQDAWIEANGIMLPCPVKVLVKPRIYDEHPSIKRRSVWRTVKEIVSR
jgi:hypothetical protein